MRITRKLANQYRDILVTQANRTVMRLQAIFTGFASYAYHAVMLITIIITFVIKRIFYVKKSYFPLLELILAYIMYTNRQSAQ